MVLFGKSSTVCKDEKIKFQRQNGADQVKEQELKVKQLNSELFQTTN